MNKQTIKLKYCQTADMVANMLTKGLPWSTFEKLRDMHGWCSLHEVRRSVECALSCKVKSTGVYSFVQIAYVHIVFC